MTAFVRNDEVARIKAKLDHPVIDGDGHLMEVLPVVFDFVREAAGPEVLDRLHGFNRNWFTGGKGFLPTRAFHAFPAENTLDRMTAVLPKLFYNRLDQIGLDFALVYPTFGLSLMSYPDDEVRQAGAYALNRYYAETFAGFRDRLEPVAILPAFTPEEAIAELEHAVVELGLRCVMMCGVVPRSVLPDGTEASWVDTLGHGSLHDYDPLWARCAELRVVPSFHGIGYGWGSRVSSRNYVHNHLGNFAAAQEAVCRSLIMGGVPKRFPQMRFAFLEGGVSWAAQLLCDLIGHFEKRNKDVVGRYDDARIDASLAATLYEEFATGPLGDRSERYLRSLVRSGAASSAIVELDDFAESGLRSIDDIVALFAGQLHFGCEADDPMNALAFNSKILPPGGRLSALFASDIGHWDVPDATDVLPEAWELVEHEHITEAQFRDFVFGNVNRMLTDVNPGFFDGTAVAGAKA